MCVFVVFGCNTPQNCNNFKEGIFIYHEKQNSNYQIIRRGNTQVEIDENNGIKDEYYIIWTEPCTYKLVLQKTNTPTKNIQLLTDTMTVKITNSKANAYDFIAFLNKQQLTGTLIKTN